jgi:hypothetical protein
MLKVALPRSRMMGMLPEGRRRQSSRSLSGFVLHAPAKQTAEAVWCKTATFLPIQRRNLDLWCGPAGEVPAVENRLQIKKTHAFDNRPARNPEIIRPFRAPPKWRSHFILAARRTKSDTLLV